MLKPGERLHFPGTLLPAVPHAHWLYLSLQTLI